jgi:1-acyl-sn-glycerol-3-phosphate acyltransferase
LRLAGWHVVLAEPVPLHCVVVFYPHTSNWDFAIGLCAKWVVGIAFRWVGKDTLFRTPLRRLFERWGGIPVNRRQRTGFIEQMREAFAAHEDFRLVIAPEGTRSRTERWRSGFYHLALAAGVPVGLAFIDYAHREIGIGGFVELSADPEADMAALAGFYATKSGLNPRNAGPVRLEQL